MPQVVGGSHGVLGALVRRGAVSLAVLTAAVLAGMVVAATAVAVPKQVGGFIGGPAGQGGGEFIQPRDVAVYEGTDGDTVTDKIFAVESLGDNRSRVQRLDRSGNFELAWGRDVVAANPETGFEVCSVAAQCQGGSTGSRAGEFDDPTGVAVDQVNGWVYVYDRDNKRVQKFDLDGNFLLMFGDDVNTGLGGDPDVCTNAGPPTDVCGPGTGGTAVGQIGPVGSTGLQVRGLAVDPVNGDVFVADPSNNRVQRFNSDGTLDAAPSFGDATEFGPNQPLHVAVDSSGIVYASDSNPSTDAQRVRRYDTATAAFVTDIASPPLLSSGTTPTVGLEIDTDTDGGGADEERLLVARDPASGSTVVQEFDIPAVPTDPIGSEIADSPHTYAAAPINGIGVNGGMQTIYIAVAQSPPSGPGHGLVMLTPPPGALGTSIGEPLDVTATSATLSGTIDVNGTASYQFELAIGAGTFTPVSARRFVTGTTGIPVTAEVSGLDPTTEYRARIVVSRFVGHPNTIDTAASSEQTFTTDAIAPNVTTVAASSISATGARLAGRVDPNGSATTYQFEYGITTGYGSQAPVSPASAGAGQGDQLVTVEIGQLQPGQTYHYRLCATNDVGTTCGADRTFTTKDDDVTLPPPGRGYELVSPADKLSGTGVGYWYQGPATAGQVGYAAIRGERFAAQGYLGSVLLDAEYSFGNDWAFAERIDDVQGWVSHSPFTRGGYGPQAYRLAGLRSASRDFELTSWNSAGVLRMFPEQASWSDTLAEVALAADWSGRWEVVAPTDPVQVVNPGGIRDILPVVAAGAPYMVFSTAHVRGLAGAGDPSVDLSDFGTPGATGDPKVVYMDDLSGGVSDTFPGTGVRGVVSVCTGSPGVDRTLLPARMADGKLGVQECGPAAPGRHARLVSERGAALQDESLGGEISADGSRVFFIAPDPEVEGPGQFACDTASSGSETECPAQLYVRQRNSDGSIVTRWISQSSVAGQDASLMGQVFFEHASADGDRVFFRTQAPLTADDPDGAGTPPPAGGVTTGSPGAPGNDSWDLYMYDLPDGPDGNPSTADTDPAGGRLVRVSGGPNGDSDCNVRNDGDRAAALRFASRDGRVAYFTCSAPLTVAGGGDNGTITGPSGSPTDSGSTNLYRYDDSTSDFEFVASLPRSTVTDDVNTCATTAAGPGWPIAVDGSATAGIAINRASCFRGTADGGFVTFATRGRLTADDPDSSTSDIYGFDASGGVLSRLTAPEAGAVGGSYACNTVGSLVECFGDGGIGGGISTSPFPLAPLGVVTDPVNGERVAFFQSKSRLVAEDADDVYDVYQWRDGELSLISTGASPSDGAFYKGNDESGRNVYFATLDRLSWQDRDAALDVYTARVGGGIPEPPEPPVCQVLAGDTCQGPGGQLVSPPVSSERGGGNAVPPARAKLSVRGLSAAARQRAARRGVLALRVRLDRAGVVRAVARARVAGRRRVVGRDAVRLREGGSGVLRLRLSGRARKALRAGKRLRVSVEVRGSGARKQTVSVQLKRGAR